MRIRSSKLSALLVTAAFVLGACGSDSDDSTATTAAAPETTVASTDAPTTDPATTDPAPTDAPPTTEAALDELIADAQAEGSLMIYSALTEAHLQRMADGFKEAYDIDVQFQRLVGPDLTARYGAEAEAGAFTADVVLVGSSPIAVLEDWVAKGWVAPLSDAELPIAADFPEAFISDLSAVIAVQPWGILYNTDIVSAADAPTSFEDLADPKWKDQILIADTRAANAYLPFFAVISEEYGDEWYDALLANAPRFFENGTATSQALAAGEGGIMAIGVASQAFGLQKEGAPVEFVIPDATAGVETHIGLTSADKSAHPNAAKLFAQWLMSPEGAAYANDIPGVFSAYSEGLPANYQRPDPSTWLTPEELAAKLGLS